MDKKILHSVWEEVAGKCPAKIAIESDHGAITYRELNKYANRISHLLRSVGAGKGTIINVAIPSSIELVGALLAVFKSGAIFLPMDLFFSKKRLTQIFRDTSDGIIVITADLLDGLIALTGELNTKVGYVIVLGDKNELLLYRNEEDRLVAQPVLEDDTWESDLPLEITGDDSSYIYYTSGSTGEGKAILGAHASLSHFIHWEIKEFSIDESFRVSQLTQVTFDASLRDIFVPLIAGGTLCIPPADSRSNPARLLKWLVTAGIDLVHCVPSLFRVLTRELQSEEQVVYDLGKLKYILLAGELLYAKDINNWRKKAGDSIGLVNLYGATETTLIKMFHRIGPVPDNPAQIIPVGIPISNTTIAVIKEGRLCKAGEIGEIYIKTPFASKGYYNNEQLTGECFVQNPLLKDVKDIVYKTGDMGRYLQDGNIELLGRLDSQVKVNGIRIELVEIEQAMLRQDSVTGAVVKAHRTEDNFLFLVAYYTGKKADDVQLRDSLAKELNAQLIPPYFFHLDEFPLTVNGKIDRKALPLPEDFLIDETNFEAPDSPVEDRLALLWKDILGVRKIGRNTSFFGAGGHSLRAIQLISRIHKEFGVDLKIADIFTNRTIREQAVLLASSSTGEYASIVPVASQPHYPLSSSQRRLWILSQFEEGSIAYNVQGVYVIEGDLDRSALELSFKALIRRHEILRTSFKEDEEGQVRQFIHSPDEIEFSIPCQDLRLLETSEEEVRSLLIRESAKPFDLSSCPLFRTSLFQLTDIKWIFAYTLHHIISDEWSMDVVIRELLGFYNAFIRSETASLPPLRIQYKDYSVWQQGQLTGDTLEKHKQYWVKQFEGDIPVLELLEDKPRPVVRMNRGSAVTRTLGPELYQGIKSLCQQQHGTLFMGLLALINTLLYRYSDHEDLIVGTPIAGRGHIDLEGQIGFYVNTLAIRIRFSGNNSFSELLEQVKKVTLDAYEHQQYPFDELVHELHSQRDMSRNPLFDVALLVKNYESSQMENGQYLSGLKIHEYYGGETRSSKFDLKFNFEEVSDKILTGIEYNSDIYHKDTIERMIGHLEQLLAAIIEQPGIPIRQLDYLAAREKYELLHGFNNAFIPYPDGKTIVQLFEDQVSRTPHKIALVFEDKRLSYLELNEKANQVGDWLIKDTKIRPGDLVGIRLDRSEWILPVILGVLKSGGAYMPIDPEYPQERIDQMIRDSRCRTLIDESTLDRFKAREKEFLMDNLPPVTTADSLAYVMYTSGSTGIPKGVMVHHRAVIRLVRSANYVGLTGEEVLLSTGAVSFDATSFEYWSMLLNGGRLVLCRKEVLLDQQQLGPVIRGNEVSMMFFTTGLFNQLIDKDPEIFSGLKTVLTGGEKASHTHFYTLKDRYPSLNIVHAYGPTENTAFSLTYPVDLPMENIPIGRPISNSTAYVLDERQQLVPVGVVGEICVGGDGLARGYQNRPELTAEKFIAHPFKESERIYRTGDWGKWLPDGNIVFMGRKDNQVKIRGFRIELGEIETALQAHPQVDSAVVIARPGMEGNKELVAYVAGRMVLLISDLRAYLGNILPAYMLPAHFVQLERLPLTQHGKVDRKQLPDPEGAGMEGGIEYVGPRTEMERHLVEVCEEILKKRPIGINDDIFFLGGDSIKSIQIVSRLKQRGYSLTIRDILSLPVIEDLAGRMKVAGRFIGQQTVEGVMPLNSIQEWFFQNGSADRHHFNQSVLLNCKQRITGTGIRAILDKLLLHHDALRMVYRAGTEGCEQVNRGAEEGCSLEIIEETSEELFRAHCDRIQSSMDLEKGPLFKVALFRGGQEDRLLLVIHHLVIDGVSWRILFEDLSTLYQQFLSEQPLQLPLKTDSFKYWVEHQKQYAASGVLKEEEAYWSVMQSIPVQPLPLDNPGGRNLIKDASFLSFSLDQQTTDLLLTQCNKAYHTDINDLLLTALSLAVTEVFGLSEILIALEGHGREPFAADLDVTRTVGWFTTIYPVIFDMRHKDDTARQLIEIKENLRRVPNKGIGYGTLRYMAKKEYLLRPEISFNYLGDFGAAVETAQGDELFEFSGHYHGNEVSGNWQRETILDVSGIIVSGTMRMSVTYSARQFSTITMERFKTVFRTQMESLIERLVAEEGVHLSPADLTYKGLSIEQLEKLNKLVC